MDAKILPYIIIIILLFAIFIAANIYKDLPMNKTKEIGFCNVPSDCDAQGLVHILCVGKWVCEQNRCGWVCDAGEIGIQTGGLSAATVECYDDSHCKLGICPGNSTYKRFSCLNSRCIEINYFADPCGYR